MSTAARLSRQRWLVPEVVQTSAMDCGPASLKCLLEGFQIPASYGRLREACQTDVDGTSIDVIEVVANQLGIEAEQVMLPVDHIFLAEAAALPAMVVVRHSGGATHFVVVWRRHGRWAQVMDPAIGRRWTTCRRLADDIFRHELRVPAGAWREWAASDGFLNPLRRRLSALGASADITACLIEKTLAESGWLPLATLDAGVRLVNALIEAKGIRPGEGALKLLRASLDRAAEQGTHGLFQAIPASYWSVRPASNDGEDQLLLRGAVLLRVKGSRTGKPAEEPGDRATGPLSPELAAALAEKPARPGIELLRLLRADGVLTPLALMGALAIAVGAVLIETLLFRGLFDIAWALNLANQRLGAVLGLMTFVGLLLLLEIPIAMESLRLGRHLETRLRMALLRKLPRLSDRYFQSRPISDMAERSHSIYLTRLVPGLGIQFIQLLWDILFTLAGIALIDPASTPLALAITLLAIGVPLAAQPLINERDLRVRSHAGALHSFYLDALLGLVPIRTHRAERAVGREHEGLLVEWARSSRSLIRLSMLTEGIQSLACLGLAGLLLGEHFQRVGVTGGVLLLVYWTLKLPALGHKLTSLAHQYPAQRNILLRLLEPLATPEETDSTGEKPQEILASKARFRGVAIAIEGGSVLAAGHTILRDIDIRIAPGQHVAIVGPSGAGKSSLIGLLLGWHRLATGRLLIDGAALTGADLEALRRETAWVDPAIQIWNRPFLDNLGYSSRNATFDALGSIIEASDLKGVLQKLPLGLQTPLGESGALLSGGEGQRVRLGRAMLQANVRLALLDEPFRGLDRDQRRRFHANARQWWPEATLLCVTHDAAETLSFNRVLVVEGGRIVEDGPPSLLASSASRYRDLLNAEDSLRTDLWRAEWWRRIHIEAGLVKPAQAGDRS
ncbi:MAG: ATP-binding cassette domain-containing protein [Gammaproteobacteria bacterium]